MFAFKEEGRGIGTWIEVDDWTISNVKDNIDISDVLFAYTSDRIVRCIDSDAMEVFDIRTGALLFQTYLNRKFDFCDDISGYFVEIACTPDPVNVLYMIGIAVAGGRLPPRSVFAKMDLVTGKWDILPSPPVSVSLSREVTITCSKEHVYIAADCDHPPSSLFVYDMALQQWQPLAQPKRLLLSDSHLTKSILLAHEGLLFAWTSWFSVANDFMLAMNVYDPMRLSWHEIDIPSSMNKTTLEGMATLGNNKDILMHWWTSHVNYYDEGHHHHATLSMTTTSSDAKPEFVIIATSPTI
jgi:hypothetical protein